MAGRTKEVIGRHNTELRKQVAELSDICSAREAEIGAIKREVGEIREIRETNEMIAKHNTYLMKQVDELSGVRSAREAEIVGLKEEIEELREKLEYVLPETDVAYLRRELAYAQGQLHQSHSTLKQLCGRRSTPDTPVPSGVEKRCEEILDRIHNLLLRWEGAEVDRINANDLAETFKGR